MCGIAGLFGAGWTPQTLAAMTRVEAHRGPDDEGHFWSPCQTAGLAQRRLAILDLSPAGHQPMRAESGLSLTFNGEIYNYRELRAELAGYPFRGASDSEVLLAAYERWGEACLDRLRGMFAFLIWDERTRSLFGARDRFGVKPLYYWQDGPRLAAASEIKALHAAGLPAEADERTWATYLTRGYSDLSGYTFWKDAQPLEPGHFLRWRDGRTETGCWYDLAARVGAGFREVPDDQAAGEYRDLAAESVRLRFRSDVPVGICLSGGLDSSLLLGFVQEVEGTESEAYAYTFVTGDENYDELPWVRKMLAHTRHRSVECPLSPGDVPALAESVQAIQDEPFGGLPTLAYARLFERARADGTLVLLDGQGMDEQFAGYDYYAAEGAGPAASIVQGSTDRPVRPECLTPEFAALARPVEMERPFPDDLRNLQYRDIRSTKIPRALRFNDRASMRASVELREPFLDHVLVEYALRLPAAQKIRDGERKWLLRRIGAGLLPQGLAEAPKRPVQTPQREWLRGDLRRWAGERVEASIAAGNGWLNPQAVRSAWRQYAGGEGDNSFYVWQWISLAMLAPRFSGIVEHV